MHFDDKEFNNCCSVWDPPVKVIVVVLSFAPEIKENKTQEEGEDQEPEAATLHLKQMHVRVFTPKYVH